MKTGSLSEYAVHAGVSAPYVTKLKKAGRIVFVEEGGRQRVNFSATDNLVRNTSDLGRARAGENARGFGERARPVPPLSGSDANAASEGAGGHAPAEPAAPPVQSAADRVLEIERASRAKKSGFDALTAELQYQKLTGALVDKARAERTVFDSFRSLRDHAFQAPQRAAARCVGVSDMREFERIFTEELRKAYAGWEQKVSSRFAGKGVGA
jgi:hypothetical protein